MKTEIGKIVLFCQGDGRVVPAIITAVSSEKIVNLRVFSDGDEIATPFWRAVAQQSNPAEPFYTWTWPEPDVPTAAVAPAPEVIDPARQAELDALLAQLELEKLTPRGTTRCGYCGDVGEPGQCSGCGRNR